MSRCRNPRTGAFASCATAFRSGRGGLRGLGHNYPGEWETGAHSHSANDVVLVLENEGAAYPMRRQIEQRLYAAWKRSAYTHEEGVASYVRFIKANKRHLRHAHNPRPTAAQIADAANAFTHALEAEFPNM